MERSATIIVLVLSRYDSKETCVVDDGMKIEDKTNAFTCYFYCQKNENKNDMHKYR